jgi:hypothetical protein
VAGRVPGQQHRGGGGRTGVERQWHTDRVVLALELVSFSACWQTQRAP